MLSVYKEPVTKCSLHLSPLLPWLFTSFKTMLMDFNLFRDLTQPFRFETYASVNRKAQQFLEYLS